MDINDNRLHSNQKPHTGMIIIIIVIIIIIIIIIIISYHYHHQGIIYTPISYSDHIPVSLLIRKNEYLFDHHHDTNLTLDDDISTQQTQPHKEQKLITNFFQPAKKQKLSR